MLEVDPAEWDAKLRHLGVTDVYYAAGFVRASARLVSAQPVLLCLESAGGAVVFACLLRSDPFDVVTPYGYGGPVAVGPDPPLEGFAAAYAAWCRDRGVVSTFAVLHPLYASHRHADALGLRTSPLGGTVAWDLAPQDLAAGMHRHHRRLVRRADAAGMRASVERAPRDLGTFVAIYEATMRRAAATPFYFFNDAYWGELAANVPLVRVDVHDRDGVLAASALGMGEPPWLHYHLGAAADAARGTGASHLALLTLARYGREHGYERLHLGGGVGGRADSLREYKLRFAPDGLIASHVGKAVHDAAAYARLSGTPDSDREGFFPAYRADR